MKIRDIVKLVDKSTQFEDEVYISDFKNEFNIDEYSISWDKTQDRLTSYYIGNWYCTDSYVGYKVYFLDDVPIAISAQHGRKCDVDIEWLSKELYNKTKEYVLTFINEEEDRIVYILADLDQDLGLTYKIEYHEQLFEYHKNIPLFNNIPVKIIEYSKEKGFNEKKQYCPSLVKILFEDNTEQWIELKELDFPYNISK